MNLSHLISEQPNAATAEFSRVSTLEALRMMNAQDQKVAFAVGEELPRIALAVGAIASRLKAGGRLFYIGAGTSGRLGVVDASECPPTFGVSPELVQGVIAGGRAAVFKSQEGAEDSWENGARDLQALGFSERDCLVGLAASGRTPYVLGALDFARGLGAWTAGITVNPSSEMEKHCEICIAPVVGPEVLTGSSRLKAGTAQKLVLNMISTGVMRELGLIEGNLMTHLQPSCVKLVDRAQRIVMDMAGVSRDDADAALRQSAGDVKSALKLLQEKR